METNTVPLKYILIRDRVTLFILDVPPPADSRCPRSVEFVDGVISGHPSCSRLSQLTSLLSEINCLVFHNVPPSRRNPCSSGSYRLSSILSSSWEPFLHPSAYILPSSSVSPCGSPDVLWLLPSPASQEKSICPTA